MFQVKEANMAFLQKDLSKVRNQLTEAEEKLSYLEKEDKTEVQENRRVCILEPLPIKMDKSSASQTDGTLKVNSSNQTPQIRVRNAGIQIDLQSECSSEEVTDIINQFTEKIEQMQELHAAEILDMESRHISETETLKREHCVAVQLLTEECGTLKAVLQCLRSKEVFFFLISVFQHPVFFFFSKFCVFKRKRNLGQSLPYDKITVLRLSLCRIR